MKNIPDLKLINNVKIDISSYSGTYRDIADRARTTIWLEAGDKEVSDMYIRKMYLSRHSPIRTQFYKIRFENIPYFASMHLARHKHGIEHFVSTQRSDRTGVNRSERKQTDTVIHEIIVNAEAIMNISNVRLCNCADYVTRSIWSNVIEKLKEINTPLASCCVPKCIREGHCYEYKSCAYHKTDKFKHKLKEYRKGINE